jgi:hypothetical protein
MNARVSHLWIILAVAVLLLAGCGPSKRQIEAIDKRLDAIEKSLQKLGPSSGHDVPVIIVGGSLELRWHENGAWEPIQATEKLLYLNSKNNAVTGVDAVFVDSAGDIPDLSTAAPPTGGWLIDLDLGNRGVLKLTTDDTKKNLTAEIVPKSGKPVVHLSRFLPFAANHIRHPQRGVAVENVKINTTPPVNSKVKGNDFSLVIHVAP